MRNRASVGFVLFLQLALVMQSVCYGTVIQQINISGLITYRERISIPRDSVIYVFVNDVTGQMPPQTVAKTIVRTEGKQVPIPFNLPVMLIDVNHLYEIGAVIGYRGKPQFLLE